MYSLTYNFSESGKLYKQRTTISIWRMLPILIRNHLLHLIICPIATVKLYEYYDVTPKLPEEETLANMFISCIVCGLAFEVTFFLCHYTEHMFPALYRKFHLLHHTTKADVALSGYYMTVLDYFGEGPIPMMMQLIPTVLFGFSSVAVIHGVSIVIVIVKSLKYFIDLFEYILRNNSSFWLANSGN